MPRIANNKLDMNDEILLVPLTSIGGQEIFHISNTVGHINLLWGKPSLPNIPPKQS